MQQNGEFFHESAGHIFVENPAETKINVTTIDAHYSSRMYKELWGKVFLKMYPVVGPTMNNTTTTTITTTTTLFSP